MYRAHLAQRQVQERARRPKPAKLAVNGGLREWVQDKLERDWSPEQVSARLRTEVADVPEMRVSAETIYQSLYVQGRGALHRELAGHLRTWQALRSPAAHRRRAAGEDPGHGEHQRAVGRGGGPGGAWALGR